MLVRKEYGLTFSHKFPDGSIMVVHFGTEVEMDTKDVDGLAKRVRASTLKDVEDACADDSDVNFLVNKIKKAHTNARKVDMAEEEFAST